MTTAASFKLKSLLSLNPPDSLVNEVEFVQTGVNCTNFTYYLKKIEHKIILTLSCLWLQISRNDELLRQCHIITEIDIQTNALCPEDSKDVSKNFGGTTICTRKVICCTGIMKNMSFLELMHHSNIFLVLSLALSWVYF